MLLNQVEFILMNNPIRALIQRQFEARRLVALGGRVEGARCLEVGCGRGIGTEIILDDFRAGSVDAFDLDPKMVELARTRLAGRGSRVRIWQGSVTEINAPDATYDAVFDFGILHHVPDWRAALRELYRVTKPGGRLFAEEVLARFLARPLWRWLLDHPSVDRFDRETFARALHEAGFALLAAQELFGDFAFFVADKPAPDR